MNHDVQKWHCYGSKGQCVKVQKMCTEDKLALKNGNHIFGQGRRLGWQPNILKKKFYCPFLNCAQPP